MSAADQRLPPVAPPRADTAAHPPTDPATAAVASLPQTTQQGEPLFTVTRGNPTPEELAALAAVLSTRQATPQEIPRARPTRAPRPQSRRVRLGLRLRPGRGAWRWAQPER